MSGRIAVAAAAVLTLAACEAPLVLDAVEEQMQEPVRRSDQFQAAAAGEGTLVVVGNQGLVLASGDSGETWSRTELPDWPALIAVTACPDGTFAALAAEGQVWVSGSDAAEWTAWPIDTEEAPQDITCGPDGRLWVVGSFSSIFSSDDAGETWDYFSLDEDLILTNVQFVDAATGWVSGEFGTVLKTTDGGATWDRLPELENSFYPQDMYFIGPDEGWVVGLQGQVLHTVDSGETWELQPTETRAPIYGIAPAAGGIYAVGGEGMVLRLKDYEWVAVDHGEPILLYLRAIHPVGETGLLVGGPAGALFVLPVGTATVGAHAPDNGPESRTAAKPARRSALARDDGVESPPAEIGRKRPPTTSLDAAEARLRAKTASDAAVN